MLLRDVDNRSVEQLRESEDYLRSRIRVLEAKIAVLEANSGCRIYIGIPDYWGSTSTVHIQLQPSPL